MKAIINSIFKTFVISLMLIANASFSYAQTASILPPAKTQLFDNNGNPLVSGKVDYYIPGTTTRKTTWQDAGQTIPNTNPVILDSAGRALMLGDGSYRQVVKDRLGNLIWDATTSSTGSGGGGTTATVGDGQPVGSIQTWAGMIAPNQYAFAYGQEFTRVGFPELFQALSSQQNISCTSGSPVLSGVGNTQQLAIGTKIESTCLNSGATIISRTSSTITASANAIISTSTVARFFPYGNGDGTLTFNAPDLRGRTLAGRDNMGGLVANRLTTTYFGTEPDALGANGGSESKTLITGNLPPYTPIGTVSVGVPAHTDPFAYLGGVQGGGSFNAFLTGPTGASGFGDVGSYSSGSVTAPSATYSGVAQGGASTPVSVIQPTQTVNYIIKISPDTNPNSYFGVASIGGMYGVITCGLGLTCAGNDISIAGTAVTNIVAGSTTITAGIDKGIVFNNAGIFATLPTINNGVLVTDGSGSPSIAATVAASNLPNPTSSTLGGVRSIACSSSNWVNLIATSGIPSCTQPSFADLTGVVNAVANSNLAQISTAYSFKGNPTAGAANAQDFTVGSLSLNGSPNPSTTTVPCETGGVLGKCTAGSIAGSTSAGVTSFDGVVGGISIDAATLAMTGSTLRVLNGTSGAVFGLLNTNKTDSGSNQFTGTNNNFAGSVSIGSSSSPGGGNRAEVTGIFGLPNWRNVASLQGYGSGTDTALFNFYQAQNYPATNNYYRALDIVSPSGSTSSIIRFLNVQDNAGGPLVEAATIDAFGNFSIAKGSLAIGATKLFNTPQAFDTLAGIAGHNSTTAVNACLAAAIGSAGTPCYMPCGTYDTPSGFSASTGSQVNVHGAGKCTVLNITANVNGLNLGDGTGAAYLEQGSIGNFKITYPNSGTSARAISAVGKFNKLFFHDITMEGNIGNGFYFQGIGSNSLNSMSMSRSYVNGATSPCTGTGLLMFASGPSAEFVVDATNTIQNCAVGINISGGLGGVDLGGNISGNGFGLIVDTASGGVINREIFLSSQFRVDSSTAGAGVTIGASSLSTLKCNGCWVAGKVGPAGPGFSIANNTAVFQFSNCHIESNTFGILLQDQGQTIINGCDIKLNSASGIHLDTGGSAQVVIGANSIQSNQYPISVNGVAPAYISITNNVWSGNTNNNLGVVVAGNVACSLNVGTNNNGSGC